MNISDFSVSAFVFAAPLAVKRLPTSPIAVRNAPYLQLLALLGDDVLVQHIHLLVASSAVSLARCPCLSSREVLARWTVSATRMDCKTASPYLTCSWMEQASEVPLKFFCLDAALSILSSMDNIDAAHANPLQPKVAVLALTLELYETLAPELRRDRENWVRREMGKWRHMWPFLHFPITSFPTDRPPD